MDTIVIVRMNCLLGTSSLPADSSYYSVNRFERLRRKIWPWRKAVRNSFWQGNGIRGDSSNLQPEHQTKQAHHHQSEKNM
jgi:hypothetical protein